VHFVHAVHCRTLSFKWRIPAILLTFSQQGPPERPARGEVMHPVVRTVLQRLGLGLLTLFIVSIVIFSALAMLPGGFAQAILGQSATPETVAAFNHEIGLDRPAIVRYFEWILGVLHGDFGNSYAGAGGSITRDVAHLIAPRLYNTFFLAIFAAVIAVPLALFLGVMAAL